MPLKAGIRGFTSHIYGFHFKVRFDGISVLPSPPICLFFKELFLMM